MFGSRCDCLCLLISWRYQDTKNLKTRRFLKLCLVNLVGWGWAGFIEGTAQAQASATNQPGVIRLVELQGQVEIARGQNNQWLVAHADDTLKPTDRLRTGENSRVALRWSDQSIVPIGASSELEILPPSGKEDQCGLHLFHGILSFFHRDKPGHIRIITDGAVAGVEGTEFVMDVDQAQSTRLSVVDGKVKFGNEQASLVLTNGEQAVVALGQQPQQTPGFIANNLLQWCFYYPAVIDPADLLLTPPQQTELAKSLADYRAGDLLAALADYPTNRLTVSDNERVYQAALLLAVGQVDKAEGLLAPLTGQTDRSGKLAVALRELVAAVKRQPNPAGGTPLLTSEQLAASYFEQSQAIRETSLKNALALARQATTNSPNFGFAWERVAELEFSFGRLSESLVALDKGLALSPRNAQALALKGFILSAENRTSEAITWFDRAIETDAALGNAWLGRGICRIRQGDAQGGRQDLLVAAALEPQRAELRSYLGKAYAHSGDFPHAERELELAKRLDPDDPTAWLYSALLKQENNQINDSIRDLEKSQELNDNRSVYHSQLLLDEDHAVRSANLARVYLDAGLTDQSLREAQRAVNYDYANYSAHLFLASSYNQLVDANEVNLRYETPAASEYFIANLLAPASAGIINQVLSEQVYAKLFDQNQLGVISDTTYESRGAWSELGAQYGNYGDFSYDFVGSYAFDPGQRPNNTYENRQLTLDLKWAVTPKDTLSFTYGQEQLDTGDVQERYFSKEEVNSTYFSNQKEDPDLVIGYHHEWSPGVQTLFLGNYSTFHNPQGSGNYPLLLLDEYFGGISNILPFQDILTGFIDGESYSTELQQIWEQADHTTIIGARYQWGQLHYNDYQQNANIFGYFNDPFVDSQDLYNSFHYFSGYAYHNWQILDSLMIEGGAAYEINHEPENEGGIPALSDAKTSAQLSPKAGIVWTPLNGTTVRGAFTRNLTGFEGGQSTRIEPSEVAGFNQAFRDLIPDSVVGQSSGAKNETYDVAVEQKFDTGTYVGITGELLYSKLSQMQGAYALDFSQFYPYAQGIQQNLDYRECSLVASADQLLGKQWSAGARYQITQSRLSNNFPAVPMNLGPTELNGINPWEHFISTLNQLNLHANWNHPSGLFASFEADWYDQSNSGFSPAEPGDDFWQLNVYAGYRFWQRRAEITVGILNLANSDYHLEPLTYYNEMAHERTLLVRLVINF
jgi:Tfp pilus assembly protein PilF